MSLQIHPSLLQRKVIHVDMDCYYAAIEMRDNPSLKGRPVIIGGSPNSRGVVCTASYEARKFGIRSAMACSQAARLCPDAVFIRPNFEKYYAATQVIREIFRGFTQMVEPLSLDEAYLDVTGHELFAVKIARLIQEQISAKLALTCSAGVAPNKLLAKIASDFKKPAGITIVLPEQALQFMERLPLRKIHGIGPVSEKRLKAFGFTLCRDLWAFSIDELTERLGKNMGPWLYARSRGIDERAVEPSRERKSIGKEDTFAEDLLDRDLLTDKLKALSYEVSGLLKQKNKTSRTITLKVKYADFSLITRSKTIEWDTAEADLIFGIVRDLLLTQTEAGSRKVRLLGISCRIRL